MSVQKKVFWGIIALLVIGVLGACQSGAGGESSSMFVGMGSGATPTPLPPTATPTATPEPPPFDLTQTDNFLLLGTDRRPDRTNWRTDSIMVVGIDHTYGRAAVLSIPRDLYINVPGYGQARINQVDYVGEKILKIEGGGPALLSQVISQTLGINTKHWARIELRGFADLVDALGGVTVHLDCPFYELVYDLDIQGWTYFELPAGDVLMDGQTAYFFVTLRYLESDFGRARRQRQFLWALRNQALSTDLILRLPELYTAFQQTFSTDLSLLEMVQLARFGLSIDSENVRASALTGNELESYITASGADVLRIADPSRVQNVISNIWSGSSLADAGRHDPNTCPSQPQGNVPSYVTQSLTPVQVQPTIPAQGVVTAVDGNSAQPTDVPANAEPVDNAAVAPAESTQNTP